MAGNRHLLKLLYSY